MPAQPHNREIYVHSGPKAGTSCSRCSLLSFGNFDYLSTDSDFRLHCDLHPPALLFASFWKKHHLALTFYMLQQDLHLGFTNMDYPVTPLSTCDSCFQLNCCSALPTSTSISNIPPAPGRLDLVPLLIQSPWASWYFKLDTSKSISLFNAPTGSVGHQCAIHFGLLRICLLKSKVKFFLSDIIWLLLWFIFFKWS